mmetsp:Transcript_19786/g.50610  ORF Transcript_19786/g.50610 Transcript_19786/m.50610 type:complete len:115 (-) Transcript_19786:710-1054(-)
MSVSGQQTLVTLAKEYIRRTNSDLPGCFKLFADNIVAFGNVGKESVTAGISKHHSRFSNIFYTASQYEYNEEGFVEFHFVRHWKENGEEMELDGIETLSFDEHNLIKEITVRYP